MKCGPLAGLEQSIQHANRLSDQTAAGPELPLPFQAHEDTVHDPASDAAQIGILQIDDAAGDMGLEDLPGRLEKIVLLWCGYGFVHGSRPRGGHRGWWWVVRVVLRMVRVVLRMVRVVLASAPVVGGVAGDCYPEYQSESIPTPFCLRQPGQT